MANSTILYCTICVLMLWVSSIHCSPTKRQTETVIDINFPYDLTQAITQALPNIKGSQEKTIALLENMTTTIYAGFQRQDQQLQSLTLTMTNIASTLQSQLNLLSERLQPSVAQGASDNNLITPASQDGQDSQPQTTQGPTPQEATCSPAPDEQSSPTPEAQPQPARDCQDIAATGVTTSGPYVITPHDDLPPFTVYCDMTTDGGGWIVFQRRFNGALDFYEGWEDYINGFGSADGEYWLGLQRINQLTKSGTWVLRVDIEAFDYLKRYAKYNAFDVGDADTFYRLSIGSYSGTAGDHLRSHNNQPFSTWDTDHDGEGGGDCAQAWRGAWWYNLSGFNCLDSNLNGLYMRSKTYKAMTWGDDTPQKKSEMKIRRIQ